jgi:trypsin
LKILVMRLFLASISISCAAFMVCADLGATKENQIYLNNDDKNTPHHVSQLVVAKRHNAGDRADAESRKHHVHKISFDDGSSPQVGSSFLTAAAAATKKNDILKKDDGISRQLEQNDDDDGILLSSTDQEDHEIVGGNVVVPFEYPFMVYAVLTEDSFCGATLVGQNCLLTAAHCEPVFSNNQVMIGKHDRTDNTEDFEVFDVEMPLHPHPNYDEVTTDYDFMIVKLNASSSFEPVELDDGTKDFAKNATVMGWGHTAWGGPSSNLLRSVDVDVYTEAECKENYPNVTDRMFCAGADGKDSCQNDSGGPIIDSVTQKQIGVVSWGYKCAEKGGVYAKVRDQIDWIKSSIDDFCGTEPSQAPTQTPIPTQTPTKNPTQNPTQAPTCENKPLGKACGGE